MAVDPTTTRSSGLDVGDRGRGSTRLSTETKHSSKTSELYAYVLVTAGVLIAGLLTKAGDGHDDRLQAHDAWLYAALLTIGYMISRGLAKSGSRDPYTADRDDR